MADFEDDALSVLILALQKPEDKNEKTLEEVIGEWFGQEIGFQDGSSWLSCPIFCKPWAEPLTE